ncbi:MAG: SseB family protein [Acidimicrobiales bacterium]
MPDEPVDTHYVGRDRGPPPRPLEEVPADVKQGKASIFELFDAFMRSRLFLPRPPKPGLATVEIRGQRVVRVFSSEVELARFAGKAKWFSTDGFDLLGMLPKGVTLGLDIASPHRLQLNPAAVRLDHAVYLPARNRPAAANVPAVTAEEE